MKKLLGGISMNRRKSYANIETLSVFFILFSSCIMLISCSAIVGYDKFYSGSSLPREQIAILTHPKPYSRVIQIWEINGVGDYWSGVIELLPGNYKICAGYADMKGSTVYRSKECVYVGFDAKPGHTYVISPVINQADMTWYPIITDITNEQIDRKQWIDDYVKEQKERLREGE